MQLLCFPVQYPPGFDVRSYTGHRLPTNPRDRELRLGGVEIAFENSFSYGRGTKRHHAIDIHGAIGLHVVSSTNGYVVKKWVFGQRELDGVNTTEADTAGFFVVLVDDNHFFHHYAHLQSSALALVRPGDRVRAGQQIGFLGMTGLARRMGVPHLHYQVRTPEPDRTGHDYRDLVFQGQGVDAVDYLYRQLVDRAVKAGAQLVKGSNQRYFIPCPPSPGVQPSPLMGWQVPHPQA